MVYIAGRLAYTPFFSWFALHRRQSLSLFAKHDDSGKTQARPAGNHEGRLRDFRLLLSWENSIITALTPSNVKQAQGEPTREKNRLECKNQMEGNGISNLMFSLSFRGLGIGHGWRRLTVLTLLSKVFLPKYYPSSPNPCLKQTWYVASTLFRKGQNTGVTQHISGFSRRAKTLWHNMTMEPRHKHAPQPVATVAGGPTDQEETATFWETPRRSWRRKMTMAVSTTPYGTKQRGPLG